MSDSSDRRALSRARKQRAMDPRFSTSMHVLLRERQRRGRASRFVAREGAGVWSPDPVNRTFGGNASVLRRLELSGTLAGHTGCVNTVSCTPDGRYWITGSDDMDLMVRTPVIILYCVVLPCLFALQSHVFSFRFSSPVRAINRVAGVSGLIDSWLD